MKKQTFYIIKRKDGKFLKLGSDIYGEDIIEFIDNLLIADKFKNIKDAVREARYYQNCHIVEICFYEKAEIKTVSIPACEQHEGLNAIDVNLRWVCPICGKQRGEIKTGYSYDGSLRLPVDIWQNPCGHIDKYANVRKEAAKNGLNNGVAND